MTQQSPLDTRLASVGLILGSLAVGYWFYKGTPGALGGVSGGSGSSGDTSPGDSSETPLQRLLGFAQGFGLTVTSTTGGSHSTNSLHYIGRAIDVGYPGSAEQLSSVEAAAASQGINVLDESYTGSGVYGYSSGPHLHLSISPPGTTLK